METTIGPRFILPATYEKIQRGKQLFAKIDPQLHAQHHGKFMTLDADSGAPLLGDTFIEADKKARAQHPGKMFDVGRIGSPAAITYYVHGTIASRSRR